MKALYRKYRPCSLDAVIGQEQITAPLAAALKSGNFSHAYLFTGPRGCGKTSVARIFAHAVNDFKYELEDEYIDIIEIDAASNTGVDNIRELREKATIVPSVGKYKVYIIDEVHMLSKSAFNALLKTLEEPPEHVVFIMATTDPEKVPITILSRAQVFQFKLVSTETMVAHLSAIAKKEKIPIEDAALEIIARRGGGSFRDSLSLLDQIATLSDEKITAEIVNSALGLPSDAIVLELLSAYASSEITGVTSLLKDYYSTGGKAEILAGELIAKILENPDPAHYHLLETLPKVSDPYAEAKLLLCFMTPTTPATVPVIKNAAGDVAAGAPRNVFSPEKTFGGAATAGPAANVESTALFAWDNFLDQVDAKSAKLYILLKNQSAHSFDGTTLTITPRSGVARKTFAQSSAQATLSSCLPQGVKLSISDSPQAPAAKSVQNPPENDSPLSKISDIMGNIQEVNTNGGIPF